MAQQTPHPMKKSKLHIIVNAAIEVKRHFPNPTMPSK
jgi:hypothetical protein